ncbi:GNAT family N-acetyltransferase [Nocardia alba]|nr:GNAT family N-acetyltransferase [Nocardia alba]
MLIRPGGSTDSAAVAALHTASWRIAYAGIFPDDYLAGPVDADHATRWRTLMTEPVTPGLFVAEHDADLVGFAYFRPTDDGRVLLDNLHAHPAAHGRGIGTGLIDAGLSWSAATYPDRPIYLEVLAANAPAIAFYEHRGWHRTSSGTVTFDAGFTVPEYEYTWRPPV